MKIIKITALIFTLLLSIANNAMSVNAKQDNPRIYKTVSNQQNETSKNFPRSFTNNHQNSANKIAAHLLTDKPAMQYAKNKLILQAPTPKHITQNTERPYLSQSLSQQKWCPPLGSKITLIRKYEKPATRYSAGHRGIDIKGDNRVLAPASGTVTFVGQVVDRPVISVKVADDTVYSIEPVISTLQIGDTVNRCQELGELLPFGHTEPGTAHLGVRIADEYTNPLPYFVSRPRLLPWQTVYASQEEAPALPNTNVPRLGARMGLLKCCS